MTRCCHCGAPLDWAALPELGRQGVPEDPGACDCYAGEPSDYVATAPCAPTCASLPYVLVHKNCPSCGTTLSREYYTNNEPRS